MRRGFYANDRRKGWGRSLEVDLQTTRDQTYVRAAHYRSRNTSRIGNRPSDRKLTKRYAIPSALLLGMAGAKAVHAVYADNREGNERIIITVYEPDPAIWHDDLKTRR